MHLLIPHRHLLSPLCHVILLYRYHPFCWCRFSVMVAAQHLMLWSKMHYYARWVCVGDATVASLYCCCSQQPMAVH